MPEYKKKKHSKLADKPKRVKKSRIKPKEETAEIKMAPTLKRKRPSTPKEKMKVVKGNKGENLKKLKIGAIAAAVVILIVTLFQIFLPVGVFDSISNALSLIGSGSYPIELEGTQTLNCVNKNSYYYILSNSHISAYSNSGKELFSYAHGFENPVLKTSSSRALVFNQGSNQALIFDLAKLKSNIKTEKPIITAAISDSGAYAIATYSDKYATAVSVYNKRGKMVYEWYSAEDTVNNVAISPNGKKIAVSTFSAGVGKFNSKISVLGFKSPTAEWSESFDGSLVYEIDSTHPSYFAVATSNKVKFVRWSGYKTKVYENEYNTAFFRAGKGGYIAVFNRDNDKTDNRIAFFNKSGKLKAEIKYNGILSDIRTYGGHIYCMSETDISLINKEGEVIRDASCGFGAVKIAVRSSNSVAVITDNKIEKVELERE